MLHVELARLRAHAVRHSALARAMAYSSILSSAILIASGWSLLPAYAGPCTNNTDTANATTCGPGSTDAGLTYVISNPDYTSGNFALTLNDHDVTGGIALSGVAAASELVIDINGTSSVSGPGVGIDVSGNTTALIKIDTEVDTTVSGIRVNVFNYIDVVIDAQGTVAGTDNGIRVDFGNFGYGDVQITTGTKSVTGSSIGINAANHSGDTVITTGTGAVTGGGYGIYGFGNNTTITTGGNVTGGTSGIHVFADGDHLKITTAANTLISGTGALSDGIHAEANSGADLTINNNAHVQGVGEGIDAESSTGTTINNTGLITAGSLRAINAKGPGAAIINNSGTVLGLVDLTAQGDTFNNLAGAVFEARGTSVFGAGTDELANAGTLHAAFDPTTLEITGLTGLETFNNNGGVISLVDGQAGDSFSMSSDVPNAVAYAGTNGRLAVDADLGPAGTADFLKIQGTTDGKTFVHVNILTVTGANTSGIPVVLLNDFNSSAEEDFDLDGPLNAGFFAWDLKYVPVEDAHKLYTSGIGVGSYEFAAGITGAQEIWQQTSGTILQRQADLRALLGTGVTPVADYAEPVEPTPVASITPGFWFKGTGAYIDRDDEEDGFTLDRRQTIWGGMAGFDFGTQDVGDALIFGVFAGYLSSDLKFRSTDTKWNYEGPTVGAYATYLDHGLYLDTTVKVDFLDIDIDPEDLAPLADDTDSDATNIGGRIDAGYKFGQAFFIEPQATLAVVHTEIDDVEIFGGTVEFKDETNIKGRLGLRLGHEMTASSGVIYSGDVTASVWEDFSGGNDVTIVDSGLPDFGVSDNSGDTTGDVALGLSALAPGGWSGFLRANYLFASDYEAVTGNAGLRYAW
jgi:autotransporter family porin